MRFYDREEQLETLREMRELSYNGYSRLTVVTGRRRIGKTTLIKEAYQDETYVYLFVGKKSESVLCGEFCEELHEKIGVFVPPMSAFRDVFRFLMEEGTRRKYTLVFDEFQNFLEINPSIYSELVGQVPKGEPCEYGCQRFCLFPDGETLQRQERTPLRETGFDHQTAGFPHFSPQTNHGGQRSGLFQRRSSCTIYIYWRYPEICGVVH